MKTVVMCGSRKFKPQQRRFARELRKLGVTVFEPYLHSGEDEWRHLSNDYKKFVALGLTHDHFYKISMADVVFVYNQDGYLGVSTTLEIGFAVAKEKPIYALFSDDEMCRNVLFRDVVNTPKEFLKYLK